ncbi:MAG TPA: hypothetical protein VGL95_07735, partial [Acetobacteraceae bacterium]
YARLQELVHPDVGRFRLGMDLETDLSDLPLDEPIPEARIPESANLHKGFFDDILRLIRDGNPTLREVYMRYERGRKTITGSPQRSADVMEEWFTAGAADGFMLQFHIMPRGLNCSSIVWSRNCSAAGLCGTPIRVPRCVTIWDCSVRHGARTFRNRPSEPP